MKRFFVLLFLVSFNISASAQEVQIGMGMLWSNATSNLIDLDSIKVFELNQQDGRRLSPSVYYLHPISPAFRLGVGFQYRWTALSIGTYREIDHPLGPVLKVSGVGLPTFEFPILLHYSPYRSGKFKLTAFAGIAPVLNRRSFDIHYEGDPNSEDFPPSIADVLNAAPTMAKKAYVNYHYGGSLSYGRFTGSAQWQTNLSRSVGKSLELWDQQFAFRRRTNSIRFILSYALWQKKEKEKAE